MYVCFRFLCGLWICQHQWRAPLPHTYHTHGEAFQGVVFFGGVRLTSLLGIHSELSGMPGHQPLCVQCNSGAIVSLERCGPAGYLLGTRQAHLPDHLALFQEGLDTRTGTLFNLLGGTEDLQVVVGRISLYGMQ